MRGLHHVGITVRARARASWRFLSRRSSKVRSRSTRSSGSSDPSDIDYLEGVVGARRDRALLLTGDQRPGPLAQFGTLVLGQASASPGLAYEVGTATTLVTTATLDLSMVEAAAILAIFASSKEPVVRQSSESILCGSGAQLPASSASISARSRER